AHRPGDGCPTQFNSKALRRISLMPRPYTRASAPANVPRSHAVVPAKARAYPATGRAGDQWVPAFAGTRLGVAKAKCFNEDWSSFLRERRDHAALQNPGG